MRYLFVQKKPEAAPITNPIGMSCDMPISSSIIMPTMEMDEKRIPTQYSQATLNFFRSQPLITEVKTMPAYMASWNMATYDGFPQLRMMYAPTKISTIGNTHA